VPGEIGFEAKTLGAAISGIIFECVNTLKQAATVMMFYTTWWSTMSQIGQGNDKEADTAIKNKLLHWHLNDTCAYTKELVESMEKDPDAFESFIADAKRGAAPQSWMDVMRTLLSPINIKFRFGRSTVVSGKADDSDAEHLMIGTMVPTTKAEEIKGEDPLADESDFEWVIEDDGENWLSSTS